MVITVHLTARTYNNPNIGDGAANNGRLSSHAYQYATYTAQELLEHGIRPTVSTT